MLSTVIAGVGATVLGSPTASYLAYRERVPAEVGAAKMRDRADLDKKYSTDVNVRLVKLVGAVRIRGPSGKAGHRVKGCFRCWDDARARRAVLEVR
jgi:hypothetical protein